MDHLIRLNDYYPVNFTHGENCTLHDDQGRTYTDLEAGCWCMCLGYNHPRFNKAFLEQAEKLIHIGTRYPVENTHLAAKAALEITGIEHGKCTQLSSGSEAVEFGIQAIRHLSGKPRLLALKNSYFGSFGSGKKRNLDEWHLFDWAACPDDEIETQVEKIPFDEIGGFIFEPGGSSSEPMRFPSKALIQAIVQKIREHNGVMMVNEITTGIGRTGKWFGFMHYDIQPDIVAMGKSIGNGFPVSITAVKMPLAEALEESRFHWTQSHQNDPLGSVAALSVIEIIREENLIQASAQKGEYFLGELKKLAAKHEGIQDARGRGLLLGIECNADAGVSGETVRDRLFEKGFLIGYKPLYNILRIESSLTIPQSAIDAFLHALDEVFTDLH